MNTIIPDNFPTVYAEEELRGFARSMAELQWLLLILVLLYFFIPTTSIADRDPVIITMVSYAAFIMLFRYVNLRTRESRWQLAIETWAMIAFITIVIWHTGIAGNPLLNLYLLVIIACAITLGKIMTLLEVALIVSCYFLISYLTYSTAAFSAQTFTEMMLRFSPLMLVAYVTSILATDIALARKKITRISHTDELTGLFNLRAFNLILEKEIARMIRTNDTFTIVMIDVDNLKHVNDYYGHSAGSRLIRVVAGTIKNCFRSSDVLARYGGDEFVILMTQTSTEDSMMAAERVRDAIHNTSVDMDGNKISTTISIGVASYPGCDEDARNVLDKADRALYSSKQTGRNTVTYYTTDLEPPPAGA